MFHVLSYFCTVSYFHVMAAVQRQVFPRDAVTAAQVRPGRWANAVTGSGSGM